MQGQQLLEELQTPVLMPLLLCAARSSVYCSLLHPPPPLCPCPLPALSPCRRPPSAALAAAPPPRRPRAATRCRAAAAELTGQLLAPSLASVNNVDKKDYLPFLWRCAETACAPSLDARWLLMQRCQFQAGCARLTAYVCVCSAWRPPCRCWRCNKEIDGYRHFRSGECVLFDEAEILRWVAALSCCSHDSGKLAMLVVHGRLDGMAGRLLAGWLEGSGGAGAGCWPTGMVGCRRALAG